MPRQNKQKTVKACVWQIEPLARALLFTFLVVLPTFFFFFFAPAAKRTTEVLESERSRAGRMSQVCQSS